MSAHGRPDRAQVAIALDVPDRTSALELSERLPRAPWVKVGLELFSREGPGVVRDLRERGHRVFLDLKLHDIPNTVAAAVRSAAGSGAELLTVHATGGLPMMAAAAEAAADRIRVVAVTLLTSHSVSEVEAIWGRELLSMRDEVVRLAELAREAGVGGVVCSVEEAHALRRHLDESAWIVTPGIRFPGGESHDQSRVATPAEAVEAGSDLLVVGRAVTQADDPAAALDRVLDAIHDASEEAG